MSSRWSWHTLDLPTETWCQLVSYQQALKTDTWAPPLSHLNPTGYTEATCPCAAPGQGGIGAAGTACHLLSSTSHSPLLHTSFFFSHWPHKWRQPGSAGRSHARDLATWGKCCAVAFHNRLPGPKALSQTWPVTICCCHLLQLCVSNMMCSYHHRETK